MTVFLFLLRLLGFFQFRSSLSGALLFENDKLYSPLSYAYLRLFIIFPLIVITGFSLKFHRIFVDNLKDQMKVHTVRITCLLIFRMEQVSFLSSTFTTAFCFKYMFLNYSQFVFYLGVIFLLHVHSQLCVGVIDEAEEYKSSYA